ncbi:MAG: coproporphyrinogen III oxidase [Flavobacteriaceae bacterium]|nr:coproporphyrinogen III oxidase [Flavobacteriaceae bacterium]
MAGIYIHIPFCKQSCYYCDFHFSTSLKKKNELLFAIRKELVLRATDFEGQSVETIYFGGGTPSLLSNEELQVMIDTIYKCYHVIKNPEITLEANPDDLTKDRIIELSQSSINRLSIGIQSFINDHLIMMNRAHNSEEATKCLKHATKYFDNISIDLIYGIPGMNLTTWHDNLHTAFNFGVNHISSYALTVEPKTALHNFIDKGLYPPLDEEVARQHFEHLIIEAEKCGFVHYETSNFGKPEYFSIHNSRYWEGKSYLGIGPSAHSFHHGKRSWNIRNNIKYILSLEKDTLPCEVEILSDKDRYNEYVMLRLRTIWGISLSTVEKNFSPEFVRYLINATQSHLKNGVLEMSEGNIKATRKGMFLIDGIASDLFMI